MLLLVIATGMTSGDLFAPPAEAHQGDPNYRSEIEGVRPVSLGEGLDFSIGNYDDFVALSNRSGKTVIVEGYRGEPYLRFGPNGEVDVNTRSPAWFLNRDRYGEAGAPPAADPDLPPDWNSVGDEGRYAWHDHRSHWMGKGVPPQVSDRLEKTEVFQYSIPLRVGGERAVLDGTLFWVGSGGSTPWWPFLLLGMTVAGATGALILRRRRDSASTESEG